MTQLLNEKTDGFMIDIELPSQVRDSIRAANHAAKPLNAIDWSALPRSDDSVTFQLRQPLGNEGRNEEEREEEEEEEEEEILDFINIVQQDEEEMPSSPPCLPDYK